MNKMGSVRGTRGKRSIGFFFTRLEHKVCGRFLCRVEAKETHLIDRDRFFEVEVLSWPAAELRQNFAQISCFIGYQYNIKLHRLLSSGKCDSRRLKMWVLRINNRSEQNWYTLKVSPERYFRRTGDTIFVPPLYCCFYVYSFTSMNILENRKDDNFESYDFLWILWTLFWANGLPVNNFCYHWIKKVIRTLNLLS